jgi:hypothetical protein
MEPRPVSAANLTFLAQMSRRLTPKASMWLPLHMLASSAPRGRLTLRLV